MKKLVAIIGLVSLSIPLSWGDKTSSLFDFCKVYGAVCFVDYRHQANFSVYFEVDEGIADVEIFRQDDEIYADQPGFWYVTDKPGFADFLIYKETRLGQQDFSVRFTDVESFAGCN